MIHGLELKIVFGPRQLLYTDSTKPCFLFFLFVMENSRERDGANFKCPSLQCFIHRDSLQPGSGLELSRKLSSPSDALKNMP